MAQQQADRSVLLKQLGPTIPTKEARRILGNIAQSTFYELLADQAFLSFKVGTKRLVDTSSLLDYLDKLKTEAQPRDPRIAKMVAARAARRAERPRLKLS